jgi:phage N-6-adenine-methyltransferase
MFGAARTQPRHKSVEWYTPSWVFDALSIDFDLDPASPHDMASAVPARSKYTVFDDGLKQAWHGRVWLNPPYGRSTPFWMRRFIDHANGIALVFSRTDALWCQEALRTADACLFVSGRIEFVPGKENEHKRSRAGAGTVMFAYGNICADALERLSDRGVYLRRARRAASLLEAA